MIRLPFPEFVALVQKTRAAQKRHRPTAEEAGELRLLECALDLALQALSRPPAADAPHEDADE